MLLSSLVLLSASPTVSQAALETLLATLPSLGGEEEGGGRVEKGEREGGFKRGNGEGVGRVEKGERGGRVEKRKWGGDKEGVRLSGDFTGHIAISG